MRVDAVQEGPEDLREKKGCLEEAKELQEESEEGESQHPPRSLAVGFAARLVDTQGFEPWTNGL
jgi:hypothetical protein